MRTRLSPGNPFHNSAHFAYVYEMIPDGSKLLDYGCGPGELGLVLTKNKNVSYVGIDKSVEMVRNAPPGLEIRQLVFPLPFKDGQFDLVAMCEVLEHIADQVSVLRELHRVLKPGGTLLVTVPRTHFFSILDTGNLKFRFPRLHKWYVSRKYSPERYEYRYKRNPSGLVGDIEADKQWHQHFTEKELKHLLASAGFQVTAVDGYGLFRLLFTFLSAIFKMGVFFPRPLRNLDCKVFHYSGLLCKAVRV